MEVFKGKGVQSATKENKVVDYLKPKPIMNLEHVAKILC